MILSGAPLKGNELEKLKAFLRKMELEYDEGIEFSVCILSEDSEIIGTGSVDSNVMKCVAIDETYQGRGLAATILSELVQYEYEHGRTHLFIYTKPKNDVLFSNMGFYTILQTDQVLFMENRKNGFENFLKKIRQETPEEAFDSNKKTGAVIANCNPFTYGHKYLFEKALEQCDYLHVFLLSDERSTFKPEERYEMVRRGIVGMERIILHWTSDYMISSATFPTYFFKDSKQGQKANCQLDLELFAKKIAVSLHITKRFVGTEPGCTVTRTYNEEMKKILPEYGVQVFEIERKTWNDLPISASVVRKCIADGTFDRMRPMVPVEVYQYITEKIIQF
ncbi:MAG: [citrate (pro-3S)-lyase] ligase [Hespellia sp.]|nr:[citrate (pro-3S)-lyase] ligase [Hespellia sp.]